MRHFICTGDYTASGLRLNPWILGLPMPQARKRHPDMKRQRSRRQRDKDLAAARALKAQYVPLCKVDRTVYVRDLYDYLTGSSHWRMVSL